MADNSTQGGADTIRDKDRAGVKTQIFGIDLGIGTGTESLMSGSMPSKAAVLNLQTGTVTSSSSTVTATTDIPAAGTVLVVIGGTYAGVNVTFEGSVDGTTWVGVQGTRTDGPVTENTSGVLTANQVRAWEFPAAAFQEFRVRATAYTSGTANVAIAASPLAIDPSPSVGFVGTSTAPAKTNASVSASSFTVLAANPSRRMALFFNDGAATVYLDLSGGTASATSYTVQIPPNGYYELPQPVYSGLITAIGSSATGTVRVTEIS